MITCSAAEPGTPTFHGFVWGVGVEEPGRGLVPRFACQSGVSEMCTRLRKEVFWGVGVDEGG